MNSGKGGNNRKNRHGLHGKSRFSGRNGEPQKHVKKTGENIVFEEKFEKNRANPQDRPQWTAPEPPLNPISTHNCSWCGKPIKDITIAINDKDTGRPVHFDCVIERISQMENLDTNDGVCYIGSGRFGIVHYNNPPDTRDFTIKKIYEWEIKDNKNEWRRPICEYFSLT